MNSRVYRISYVFSIFLLLGFFIVLSQAQLPSIVDPLYTQPIADPLAIPKYVNNLPIVPRLDYTGGITTSMNMGTGLHDFGLLPGTDLSTTVWGYSTGSTFGYLGPTIVAKKDNVVNINWSNQLGYSYPLPLDATLHWAFSHGYNITSNGVPVVPHLHGGHTESASDGLPEAWWTPNGVTGDFYVKNNYTYHNDQEAATLWYHDHTLGITRLNVYMGLAAFYLLRDSNEEALIASNSIPSGAQEIEIVIQDKTFYPNGALAYPDVTAPNIIGFDPFPGGPSVQPEFFGEVIIVNGVAWPVLNVEPRKYRFRLLNGSDSRFYQMRLNASSVQTTVPLWWTVIGSDDGFLNAPVTQRELLIAPGERYDVVVDFSDPALLGQTIIVRNNARSPFPKGAPVNPNTTGQIMAFKVGNTPINDPVTLPASLRLPITPLVENAAPRKLLLFEGIDNFGRLQPMLGIVDPNNVNDGTLLWTDDITENPMLNNVEVWEVYNSTADAHPIHIHLVKFQILGRQKFSGTIIPKNNTAHDGSTSLGGKLSAIRLKGKEKGPSPEEAGWKDTAIMYPGEVTRVIASYDREGRYVWHCHILSHEDHEMMRPYEVIGPALVPGAPIAAANASSEGFEVETVTPDKFALEANFPNPFNPTTEIRFRLPEASNVELKVFNTLGQEVITLAQGAYETGIHSVVWNARDKYGNQVPSGLYIYRITAGNFVQERKMMLLK